MKQKIFQFLADLRFSIFILLLISFCSIIGTIIEQDQSIEVYKLNYPLTHQLFGVLSWNQILKFGLNHVYRTWWFFSLIIVFGLSLTICTFLQQFPALKIARRCQFFRTTKAFNRLKISTILTNCKLNTILISLKTKNYSLFQQKNIIYCYKGLVGRIAPIIVHFSMILILSGTLISSLTSFKAQEIIPKNETFQIQNIFNTGQLTIVPSFSARINDFWITYTKQKLISQFYSDVSILNYKGTEVTRQTSFVNTPLIYDKTYYYQTDWNLLGLRFQDFNKKILEYPLLNLFDTKNKKWLTWISSEQNLKNGFIAVIDNLQGYCSVYDSQGFFLGNLELNESLTNNEKLLLVEILSSTGLQIKSDPGIPVIYTGFFFLMVSTLISYITYSQIWIIKTDQKIFLGGNTTRAIFEFELEFLNLIK